MNKLESLRNCTIEPSAEYGHEVNSIISTHNMLIDTFANNVINQSLIQLLINKGIITNEEYDEILDMMCEQEAIKHYFKEFEEAHDHIVEFIEAELTYLKNIKDMHDSVDMAMPEFNEDDSSAVIDEIFNTTEE